MEAKRVERKRFECFFGIVLNETMGMSRIPDQLFPPLTPDRPD